MVKGTSLEYRPHEELSICGANERYAPPIVQYRDFLPQDKNVAMLLFRVDETTSRSQFLAHYAFTPASLASSDTALQIRGGTRVKDDQFSDGESP